MKSWLKNNFSYLRGACKVKNTFFYCACEKWTYIYMYVCVWMCKYCHAAPLTHTNTHFNCSPREDKEKVSRASEIVNSQKCEAEFERGEKFLCLHTRGRAPNLHITFIVAVPFTGCLITTNMKRSTNDDKLKSLSYLIFYFLLQEIMMLHNKLFRY